MAYFLKKTKLKNRTYLSIVESFYNPEKKGTAHRVYKSLQSLETLVGQGLEDPIAYYQKEVDELNKDKSQDKQIEISGQSPKRYLGYFPLKAIMKKLKIQYFVNLFKLTTDFDFDLYEILSSLVYARCVNPCSKSRTFHDVLPYLNEGCYFSYDQLLRGLDFYGNNYEKFVELFTAQVSETFGLNTNNTYFDCTNFYFEIDREDDFRRKGPSKENRKEPIVGLGLLLDANQIPIGMKMFPGNESEKPVIREVIDDLKKQNNITGKTIQVADKGLNCSENIITALKNGDGYIFSKSVKQLSEKEMVWVELDRDWHAVKNKEGKLLYKYKECVDAFPYTYAGENGKTLKVKIKEKRVLTYNPSLAEKQKFEIRKMAEKVKDLCYSKAKRAEYGDYGKYVTFKGKSSGELAIATVNQEAIDNDLRYAGLNMIVTSEVSMSAADIYSTYHNLWRIEESFRIMKSDLDARPVFLQKENTIKGHFLICYIAVLLERILQFRILGNKHCSSEIYQFFKDFIIVKGENRSINLTSKTDFIAALAKETDLPLLNLNLTDSQVKKIMNWSV
jgi:transposase